MAECGWKGPFDTPCHFTAGHGSAHSQMGGSEDDRYGNERRHRTHSIFDRPGPRDTRSKDQKLEAIIDPKSGATEGERENAKHLLFKRRQKASTSPPAHDPRKPKPDPGDPTDYTRDMPHTDFMDWLRHHERKRTDFSAKRQPAPHVYEAHRGSDALGCTHCARSKDNPTANHVKVLGK